MNSVRSNNISLKYQRFSTLGSKDIGIINSEFVAKTHIKSFLVEPVPVSFVMIMSAWKLWKENTNMQKQWPFVWGKSI